MVTLLRQPVVHLPNWSKFLVFQAKSVLTGQNQDAVDTDTNPLIKLPLFAELSENEQQIVFGQMRSKVFEVDEVIFSGDDESTALYLVKEGRVNLYQDDNRAVEDTRVAGDLFGHTEFLLKQPRSRSARAAVKTTVWYLDEPLLTSIVTANPNIGLRLGLTLGRGIAQYHNYLASQIAGVSLLSGLSNVQRRILARFLSPVRCMPQEIIYHTADPPTGIFLIEQGTVLLRNRNDGYCARLEPGRTFGERAVVFGTPHTYTARAETELILWLLSPADFAALASVSPSTTATISHNLYTALTEAIQVAVQIMDNEINALNIVAGEKHPLIRKLHQVRRTLLWIKNNQVAL